jgi:hypothetical protein
MSKTSDISHAATGASSLTVAAANLLPDNCDDALMAGAASIADIDRLMDQLQNARDFLQSEGEKLQRMSASYANLARTASASAKVIAESLGSWRGEGDPAAPLVALPQGPSLISG